MQSGSCWPSITIIRSGAVPTVAARCLKRSNGQCCSLYQCTRYELKNKRVATVSKNNYVCLGEDKHYYSVPYHYIGKKVSILYSQSKVDIYYRYEHIAYSQA